MTDMMNDLNEAISKNLPAAVGTELKKCLEQAERDARDLKTCQDRCAGLDESLKRANTELGQRRDEERCLRAREDAVAVREKEIQKLELTSQFEKEKTSLVLGMFNTVFRNRIVREEALVQRESVQNTSYPGGGGQESRFPMPVEEKKTTEHE